LELPTVVVDNDQMQSRGLKEACKLNDPSKARIALGRHHDVARHSRALSHLALAQIGKLARSAHVPIRREIFHAHQCVRQFGA
jgi:hypothetical protein